MSARHSVRLAWTALLAACAPGCYVATVGGLVADDAGRDGAPDAVMCGATQTLCSGACVDTQSDPMHCGGCASACVSGAACTSGVCAATAMDAGDDDGATCTAGLVACAGACVDTQSDLRNCGACGAECVAGTTCTAGVCVMTPPDAGMDVPVARMCRTDGDCLMFSGGSQCIAGACSCLSGDTACSGTCVTLTTDSRNCGACGVACTSPATCAMGVCR